MEKDRTEPVRSKKVVSLTLENSSEKKNYQKYSKPKTRASKNVGKSLGSA